MKYSSSNKPFVCMQTQSTCYKGTTTMTPVGILWHSTGANNKTLKRYVQPSDTPDSRDTITKARIGTNTNKNDWNHITRQAGLNCWIGTLADGTVTTIQTMPWNYKPWGCGSGSKGSCNSGWIQFEICEDALTDAKYFNAAYKEACEITAYLCKMYNIDPNGTVTKNGVKIPTITCHQDAYKLGFGSNHSDVNHWFPKFGKSMATARQDVAALLNSTVTESTTQSTTVKTYNVVVDKLPKYSSSNDAKAKINSKGSFAKGTYYIYNKYPNGFNGMYNITSDKTGAEAGSWINPSENVIAEANTPSETKQLYRVRLSKDDAKSQKGAYAVLENAITCCQSAGAGYKVFDSNYNVVYEYKAPVIETPTPVEPENTPVEPTPEATTKAVYDLDYPEKNLIIDKSVKRTNTDCAKAIKKILSNNKDFDINITKAFFSEAIKYGIDPVMAISQSILETGWFKFAGSSVKPEQHNYCGLGATGGGVSGASFDTIEDGVHAQLQHLYAYGCKDDVPSGVTIVDPRFKYVTRGIAPYWQQLAGRWAVPGFDGSDAEAAMKAGTTYGQKIRSIYNTLNAVTVTDDEIKKWFPTEKTEEPKQEEPTPVEPENSVEPTEDKKVNGIVELIIEIIKKLISTLISTFSKGDK